MQLGKYFTHTRFMFTDGFVYSTLSTRKLVDDCFL